MRDRDGRLIRHQRLSLLVRFQVEQQQGSFGQQGAAPHGTQVIQQGQQHQGQIAAARKHPIQIGGQLHHCPHERIEAVVEALFILACIVRARLEQIARDVLHLLGQQRGAVDLDESKHAVRKMQFVRAFRQQRGLVGAFGVSLQRYAGVEQRLRQFLGDDVQCLRTDVVHVGDRRGPRIRRRNRSPCGPSPASPRSGCRPIL